MSGHSKWENIKRKKGVEDKKRGQVFSRFARQITACIREEGSADPDQNAKLRSIIDEAKSANMPKSNIDRLLQKEGEKKDLETFFLEGYGPQGLAVMVEIATDNRQRTTQEMKSIFRRFQGSLSEPGAVAFQFERQAVVRTPSLSEEVILQAGEWGAGDFKQKDGKTIFYLPSDKLAQFKEALESNKVVVLSTQWTMIPKNPIEVTNSKEAREFLEHLEDQDDVLGVFSNLSS